MKARFLALAALLFGLAACQTEPEGLDVNLGGEQTATISVVLPDDAITRAAADETNSAWSGLQNVKEETLRVIFQVYDEDGVTNENLRQVKTLNDGELTANFDVRLVPDRQYTFVAWADQGEMYFDAANLKDVKILDWKAMDECRDAYTATHTEKKFNSASNITLKLTRPFAKLRVITTDMEQLGHLNIAPAEAEVEYTVALPNAFNAFAGETCATTESKSFTTFDIAEYNQDAANTKTLFTDYILVPANNVVKFSLKTMEDGGREIKTNNFNTDIPVKRNNLTTIAGNILTEGNDINVTIDERFENGSEWDPSDDKYDVEVWDGKSMVAPLDEDNDNIYEIERPSEFAWLAAAVNGTLETRAVEADNFSGKTFVLTRDIDLGGNEWTPIGSSNHIFKGTFDGQGHTIANLLITGNNSNVGLFGVTHDGEIKNFTLENAKVSGRLNVGAVCGQPYTSKYTDITVTGLIEINGMAYVGGVGGKNAYADWTNIKVEAAEGSYVKANSVENGTAYRTYVGGVVGFNGEGGHSFKNITSNIDVKGSTIDVGGLFGIAHYDNKFENCVCTGNVEIYAAKEAEDAEEIGGIAGVWHNENGTTVTMANVEFTGKVTTNIARGNVWYNNLVGKPYGDGEGKLVLNGYEMVVNGLGVNEEDEYLVTATEGLEYIAEQVNAGIEEFTDADIVLNGDIDLAQLAAMTRSAVANNWTPIGTEEHPFKGTFDGKGKTIKNLALVESEAKEGKAYIGFFGYAKDATIKNVTFENVYINIPCKDIDHSQGHIGAVAGSLEGTSTIENVTVKGDIKIEATPTANGASRVAVVAGGNSYGDVTMKNVHVHAKAGSYLKANNNTGAIAGQLQGKTHYENCFSNIDVTVNKFFAGGIVGLAGTNDTFINCHTTGNISVVAGREGKAHDQYRVGGIAGGWSDGKTNVLTLVNCSYTGTLTGKNSNGSVTEVFDYMGYVGRGYTLNGCQGSKVVIDGVEFIQKHNTADKAGIYDIANLEISSKADMFWFAQMVNSNKCTFAGQTVKLAADIDLDNEKWTPIGSAYQDHGFMGNFDGNGYTIKNLAITEIAADADGYVYAGLFGVTEGTDKDNQNYIKNLVIENVNIATEGHIVAAAIAYPYYTKLENIKVKGNVNIKGGDYTAGVLAYTRRCVDAKNISIEATNGSIEGNITVGGVISDIQMNGGLKANYSNFKAEGLTIKAVKSVGGISGIISNQTLNGATVKNVNIDCNDVRTGIVVGAYGDKSTITNVSYENVTGATRVIGATWEAGNYVGQIVEVGDQKAVVFSVEDGVKAVSVEEKNLKGMTATDAATWAEGLGEGWKLASIYDLDAIHAARKALNVALAADNAENALFCETDYYTDGKYALYISSTDAEGNDPQGEAYFSNRVHVKYFNLNGYWDYNYSTFATISKVASLKDNYFARAVYTL